MKNEIIDWPKAMTWICLISGLIIPILIPFALVDNTHAVYELITWSLICLIASVVLKALIQIRDNSGANILLNYIKGLGEDTDRKQQSLDKRIKELGEMLSEMRKELGEDPD